MLAWEARSGIAHYASAMAYEKITFSATPSGVATIALNEPETRNALSDDLLAELVRALEACRDDEAVRCVVLTSTHSPPIPAWVVQENVIATETGGSPFPGGVTSVDTPPLATNPPGAPCAAYPPGNVYPIGYVP